MTKFYTIPIIVLTLAVTCKSTGISKDAIKFAANTEEFEYYGRYEHINNDVALISPGAYVSITFSGNYCEVFLKAAEEPYNYVSLELDGVYLGKRKIEYHDKGYHTFILEVPQTGQLHNLKVFKESENFNGSVLFNGVKAEEVVENPSKTTGFIEFIGDSITCGAASDDSEISCETGAYFDHQNVYYSYGAYVARALQMDFMLSSVSGIGMYRNWNDENVEEPIMPTVYKNLYLDANTSKKYSFKKIPDVVSICLGTNDFSKGDGVKPRLPFNKDIFVTNYINFVETVYQHYPDSQIVLLSSPMVSGADSVVLVSCLKEVQLYFATHTTKSVLLFEYNKTYTNGCLYHPSVDDHKNMSKKLVPFLKSVL